MILLSFPSLLPLVFLSIRDLVRRQPSHCHLLQVHQARGLPNVEGMLGGKNDPYCRVRWARGGSNSPWQQTEVHHESGQVCHWNQQLVIPHSASDAASVCKSPPGGPCYVEVEVLDHNKKKDTLIGSTKIEFPRPPTLKDIDGNAVCCVQTCKRVNVLAC